WPFLALLPALAQHQLSEQARGYSWLLSATGFGALTAAWVVATFSSAGRRRAFLAAGVGLVSVGLIGLSFVDSLWVAMSFCGLVGFGLILFFSTGQAVLQLSADDHNRGRIMGAWSMVFNGALPLGHLIVGPAADYWGEPVVLRVQGLTCLAAAAALLALFW